MNLADDELRDEIDRLKIELKLNRDEIDKLKAELNSNVDGTNFLIDSYNKRLKLLEAQPVYEQDLLMTFFVVTIVTLMASLGTLYATLKFNSNLQDSMYTTIITNWFTNIIFSMTITRKKTTRRSKSHISLVQSTKNRIYNSVD